MLRRIANVTEPVGTGLAPINHQTIRASQLKSEIATYWGMDLNQLPSINSDDLLETSVALAEVFNKGSESSSISAWDEGPRHKLGKIVLAKDVTQDITVETHISVLQEGRGDEVTQVRAGLHILKSGGYDRLVGIPDCLNTYSRTRQVGGFAMTHALAWVAALNPELNDYQNYVIAAGMVPSVVTEWISANQHNHPALATV